MTKEKARIILLEQELEQAQYTVEFLHCCLTLPKDCKYGYPEQTLERLKKWRELVPPRSLCYHSGPVQGCQSCEEGSKYRRERVEALEVLELRDD